MENFTERIPDGAVGDDVFIGTGAGGAGGEGPAAGKYPGKGLTAAVDRVFGAQPAGAAEVDPKLARKEAVNDMKKSHIMDAAIRVIDRDGYMSARLEDIAEEAGFSKASIYHYFPDKEALLIHIMVREQKADYEKCFEAAARGLPFMEFVKAFVEVFFDHKVLESGNMMGGASVSAMSSIMATMTKHDSLMGDLMKYKFGIYELLRQTVEKARADGVLNIPADDAAVCNMIISFVHSAFMGKTFSGWVKGFADGNVPCMPEGVISDVIKNSVDKFDKMGSSWVFNALAVFLEPWVKDSNPHRRWYDVQGQ